MAVLTLPALLAKAWEHGLREFVESRYGLPILHDFGEGEFPRMIAAIRSIESAKDNRMVMVTQERLAKLQKEVPAFLPIIERLPEPGPSTYSCLLQGVCSEWSNGWMPFWVKDAAFQAGLTPTLPSAQAYFRSVRASIQDACAAGRLRCIPNGEGFVPPMQLRWISGYVDEAYRVARLTLAPRLYPETGTQVVALPPKMRNMYADMGLRPEEAKPSSTLGAVRAALVHPYQVLGAVLLLAALAALGLRVWIADRVPLGAVALVGAMVGLYGLFRLAMLTYFAVFFGALTSRFVISTYTVSILVALPFIAETIRAWRKPRSFPA